MKTCSKCNKELDLDCFYKCKSNKDGLDYSCKECKYNYYINNKEKYKEKYKEYRKKNKEKAAKWRKEWGIKNKEKISKERKEYYQKNKEEILRHRKEYYQKNKEEIKKKTSKYQKNNKKKRNKYDKKRRKTDLNFKLTNNLRSRVRQALKRISKSKSTMKLLGCSIEKLKQHLESQFQEGMTWKNWSRTGWHIDHIVPCDSFDLTNKEAQKECFNYKNLQPLWAKDNLSKNDKLNWSKNEI